MPEHPIDHDHDAAATLIGTAATPLERLRAIVLEAAEGLLGADTREDGGRDGRERQINIHFEPRHMAGKYANFANVSHSDYEFTVTFARVDHEVEDDEIPGVVVSRINLSPRFMRELIDAMEDNYSKWQTKEGIKSLPEYDGPPNEEPDR